MVSISFEKKTTISDMKIVIDEVMMTPHLNISFTLWGLPAPRFCPVRAETAMLIDMAGIKASMSTLPTAPKAFVAALPKEFTKVVINIVANGNQRLLDD